MPRLSALPRQAQIALIIVGASLALFLIATALERLLWRGEPLPGVRLSGVRVEGHSSEELLQAITTEAQRLESTPIVAVAGDERIELDPHAFGLDVDEQATHDAVLAAGRNGGPTDWLFGAVTRRLNDIQVDWQVQANDSLLDEGAAAVAEQVDRGPQNGRLSFEGGEVQPAAPQPGRKVIQPQLALLMTAEVTNQGQRELEMPFEEIPADVGQVDVDEVAAQAEQILSEPVALDVEGAAVELAPEELATAMTAEPKDGVLQLAIDQGALHKALAPKVQAIEQDPQDATFQVTGNGVTVIPSRNGRAVDTKQLAEAILAGQHQASVGFRAVPPSLNTEAAQGLGIEAPISTFTSAYPAGQARVKNIQRAAELLQNAVIRPGEQFSLNGALGPRTKARGFVGAPVIYDGEFTEDVGGGISQMATTMFNAAFFAALPIDTYQAHSYYISRYPMGREATVSMPAPDLKFTNNTDFGILVRTRATATEVTVTFYSTDTGVEVTATEPNVLETRQPEVEQTTDPEKVTEGHVGYDVEVFRVIKRPGQPEERERFFTRYDVQNTRVLAT